MSRLKDAILNGWEIGQEIDYAAVERKFLDALRADGYTITEPPTHPLYPTGTGSEVTFHAHGSSETGRIIMIPDADTNARKVAVITEGANTLWRVPVEVDHPSDLSLSELNDMIGYDYELTYRRGYRRSSR